MSLSAQVYTPTASGEVDPAGVATFATPSFGSELNSAFEIVFTRDDDSIVAKAQVFKSISGTDWTLESTDTFLVTTDTVQWIDADIGVDMKKKLVITNIGASDTIAAITVKFGYK